MTVEYRFLTLNAAMRPVQDMTLMCLSDADALIIAHRLRGGDSVEVWDGRRLVGFAQSPAAKHSAEIAA